jgi:RNA polymerase sigma-70 factor (ECF subfamily)
MQKDHVSQQDGRDGVDRATVQELHLLYREYADLIYYYVYKSVEHHEDAEDLTAEIFLKAVQAVEQRSPREMKQWLFQVMRTTIVDYWRERPRVLVYSLEALRDAGWDTQAQEVPTSSSRLTDQVRRLLEALPHHYREVLIDRFLLGLSIRETALRMQLTVANVKVLQLRALKRAAELESGVMD